MKQLIKQRLIAQEYCQFLKNKYQPKSSSKLWSSKSKHKVNHAPEVIQKTSARLIYDKQNLQYQSRNKQNLCVSTKRTNTELTQKKPYNYSKENLYRKDNNTVSNNYDRLDPQTNKLSLQFTQIDYPPKSTNDKYQKILFNPIEDIASTNNFQTNKNQHIKANYDKYKSKSTQKIGKSSFLFNFQQIRAQQKTRVQKMQQSELGFTFLPKRYKLWESKNIPNKQKKTNDEHFTSHFNQPTKLLYENQELDLMNNVESIKVWKKYDEQIQHIEQKMKNFQKVKRQLHLQSSRIGQKQKYFDSNMLNKIQSTPIMHLSKLNINNEQYLSDELDIQQEDLLYQHLFIKDSSDNLDYEYCGKNTNITTINCKPLSFFKDNREQLQNKNNVYQQQQETIRKQAIPSKVLEIDIQESQQVSLNRLISALITQINYDRQFIDVKKWFNNLVDQRKWKKLQLALRSRQQQIPIFNIKKLTQTFSIATQQLNPFTTIKDKEFNFDMLVELFIKAQRHWTSKIVHRFEEDQLISSGILEILKKKEKGKEKKKEIIKVQDLVRLVNFHSCTGYYRNRDLLLILYRFQGKKQKGHLTYDHILQMLSQ